MVLSFCLEDRGGLSFQGKRLSRDRLLTEDLWQRSGQNLWMAPESACLFAGKTVTARRDFLTSAPPEAWCFAEHGPLYPGAVRAEKLAVYWWNRRYPADVFCDVGLTKWHKAEELVFCGFSHPEIRLEVYER